MTVDYRHLLVLGHTVSTRRFYHLNTEHAISDANAEVRDGEQVHSNVFEALLQRPYDYLLPFLHLLP